jgi:HupE / UreJ protein
LDEAIVLVVVGALLMSHVSKNFPPMPQDAPNGHFTAFSIAYTASIVFFKYARRDHFVLTSVFGLVHGLGFASAIQDLQLPRGKLVEALVGFNLGIEAAQVLLISFAIGGCSSNTHCTIFAIILG